MKLKRFNEMANKFNYDYIVKSLVREFNWGNTISDLIPDFEKSDYFQDVSDNESYITQFNTYLMYKNSGSNFSNNDYVSPEPISWYSKLT